MLPNLKLGSILRNLTGDQAKTMRSVLESRKTRIKFRLTTKLFKVIELSVQRRSCKFLLPLHASLFAANLLFKA